MKKKIIILLSLIGLFLVGGFIVFAATVKIEYKYNSSLDAPTFDYTLSGSNLSIVKNDKVSNTSTIDVVLPNDITISEDEVSVSSSKYNVYTNLVISKTYTLSAIPSNVSIFANNIVYSDDTKTIYQNEYISSFKTLDMANYSKYYNNLFDYFENKDKEYSQRFIFIDDITIDTEYSITRPISLDILKNVELTLKANLNILNTHAGNYYLNNSGNIISQNNTKINLKTSKASYLINSNIEAYISSDNEVSSSDAQRFILNYIPNYLVKDIYLPKSYMSSFITFSYEIGKDEDEKEEFTGSVSDRTGKYTVYITISDGEEEISLTKDIILGNTDECLLMVLNNELNDSNLFKDYDLLNLINSLNIKRDLSLKLDNAYFVYNSINSSKEISLKYDAENKLFKLDETSINSLVIRRRLSSSNIFKITIGNLSQTIYLSDITKEEKVSYLKDYLHTYVVTKNNSPYDIFYVNEKKTYLGTTLLFDGLLFDDLNCKILDSSNNEYKGITFNSEKGSIIFDNPEDDFDTLYLTYFDGDEELFKVDIKRSLNGSSGENSDFESNNPFDILFTDETNWLETNTFEMPANYSEFYANISIISINGVSYNYDVYTEDMTVRGTSYEVKTHNMISITKDNVLGTTNYAKKINIVIDPNYIPSTNSIVSIRCELYNNGDGAKTVTAIHNYTLTIPGILKCGEFNNTSNYSPYIFSDNTFYNEIVSYLKNQNMNDYYQEANKTNYILSNFKYLEKFDLGIESSNELDISGIEMLTNATSIILDNINLKDLSPFRYFTSDSLKTLSLKNCTLNYNKVQFNLYSLELNSLDLSNNDLSSINSFSHMFFRTIRTLSLNNTKLTTILGIDDVISVETLDIRNNSIDIFESLKYLKNLKDVYLDGNTNTSDYYGTNGLINQCVYYWMLKTNKTNVYLTSSTLYTVGEDEALILALNAFVIPTKIGEKEKAYLKEKFASFNTETIKFEIISFESGKLIIKASENSLVAYREFYYEEA